MLDEALRTAARSILEPGALEAFVESLDDAAVERLCSRLASEVSTRWMRAQPGWEDAERCVRYKYCYMPVRHGGPCMDGLSWLKGIERSVPASAWPPPPQAP